MNRIAKICIISAALLVSGVLIAQAVGFVSYEPDADPKKTKIILWDNVRMINKGLKMSALGVADMGDVAGGNITIENKDLFIRSYLGLNCPNYPQQLNCKILLGNIGGNIFLVIDKIKSDNLVLKSDTRGIKITANKINMLGQTDPYFTTIPTNTSQFILTADKNLILTDKTLPAGVTKSIFVNTLNVDEISNNPAVSPNPNNLYLPNLLFDTGGIFQTERIININVL